jgi:hypothetical protein
LQASENPLTAPVLIKDFPMVPRTQLQARALGDLNMTKQTTCLGFFNQMSLNQRGDLQTQKLKLWDFDILSKLDLLKLSF